VHGKPVLPRILIRSVRSAGTEDGRALGRRFAMGKEVAGKVKNRKRRHEASQGGAEEATEPKEAKDGAEEQGNGSAERRVESAEQGDGSAEPLVEGEEEKEEEQRDRSGGKKSKKMKFDMETLGGGIAQVEGIMSTTAFESLPVSEPTKNAIKDTGFTHMTEVRRWSTIYASEGEFGGGWPGHEVIVLNYAARR
jgi:hypothetical protein